MVLVENTLWWEVFIVQNTLDGRYLQRAPDMLVAVFFRLTNVLELQSLESNGQSAVLQSSSQ